MHVLSVVPSSVLSLLLAWCLIPAANANMYLIINDPAQGAQWSNGAANHISWTKGLLDGVNSFDIELSRLSVDGLIYVASYVPSISPSLNVMMTDVPPGDDYFLLFVNSTVGLKYGTSSMFSIRTSSNATTTTPDPTAPTVTISGSPNSLSTFATTFPASANGVALPGFKAVQASMPQLLAISLAMMFCLMGGVMTVL
ncbi:hypothetical protein EUX98_g5630 [Antrodiella citrinella]|uniref:Uncharacterized protein n=1 Tax=Antrodiella citrinella TaxID=2447956 RepID=A0A4S4MQZ8_9APHY|nr:hypothetical protein EUX98_g5630 [Antrodiella citrinella]